MLKKVAREFGLGLQYYSPQDGIGNNADIILFSHSEIDPATLDGKYRGTHVIRDPRDLLVSAYFYHLRTQEAWCTTPNPKHNRIPDDMSYQQYLQTMSIEQGLIFELDAVAGGEIRGMRRWNYHNENILELRFEDFIGNERQIFTRIFEWYGFAGPDLTTAVDIADRLSLNNVSADDKSARHARQGSRVGQWGDFFTPEVSRQFKRRYARAVVELGYAENNDW